MSNILKMLQLAKNAMHNSYSPYSNFMVGACVLSTNNNFYASCNVENASSPVSTCAEAGAVSMMISGGDKLIKEILVLGKPRNLNTITNTLVTPCGICRQRISEFATNETLIHVANEEKVLKTFTLSELLPFAFGPSNLNV